MLGRRRMRRLSKAQRSAHARRANDVRWAARREERRRELEQAARNLDAYSEARTRRHKAWVGAVKGGVFPMRASVTRRRPTAATARKLKARIARRLRGGGA